MIWVCVPPAPSGDASASFVACSAGLSVCVLAAWSLRAQGEPIRLWIRAKSGDRVASERSTRAQFVLTERPKDRRTGSLGALRPGLTLRVTMQRESNGLRARIDGESTRIDGEAPNRDNGPVVLPDGTNVRLGVEHAPPLRSTQQQAAVHPSQPDGPGTAEDAPT